MFGSLGEFYSIYLFVLGGITTTFFALPLFLKPLVWARLMFWKIPVETDLAVYFGRCLGAFILVVEYFIFKSAFTGEGIQFLFEMLTLVYALMFVAHVYGAIKRIQPLSETLEIGMWALLLGCNYVFYPLAVGVS